ncbi:hypothetical protein J3L18_28305 [Mucilaginibacter gossypii]|uniref:hypothetical protein n=1 Tax=Mucilaginibacter gossypii TaxID=551996 RepID=UPI000DCB3803|nr:MULTISPECIES: hypothetical protein [Mucilaginibacter]QTE36970.1 hypothetical protein J3L18_28305 [Mucilaginibacter gossypii]RAV45766.1 hypothetical protein DIU36_30765 [Mucilaginibacter rubeus]
MAIEEELVDLVGYHGTNLDLLPLIDKESLKISKGRVHWFGSGCYFFAEGINTLPIDQIAKAWAIDQAWDGNTKSFKYSEWMILECKFKIAPSEILDLTLHEGLKLFNEFRDSLLKKLFEANKRIKVEDYQDSDVFDIMKQNLDLKVIIGNVFIKYAELRTLAPKLQSRVPNVTMFCVQQGDEDFIYPYSMKLIKKGQITWT